MASFRILFRIVSDSKIEMARVPGTSLDRPDKSNDKSRRGSRGGEMGEFLPPPPFF